MPTINPMIRWLTGSCFWALALMAFAHSSAPTSRYELRDYPLQKPVLNVLIFWDTECPISQKTTRRVQQLADYYQGRVQFEAVYPTQMTTLAEVKEFEKTHGLTFPHRLDPAHRLVKQYDVTTTPEVIFLSNRSTVIYRGSVDDQFYRLGRSRPAPTAFYLKDAIDATLAGQPVSVTQTTPTGCLINRD